MEVMGPKPVNANTSVRTQPDSPATSFSIEGKASNTEILENRSLSILHASKCMNNLNTHLEWGERLTCKNEERLQAAS